jgi:hypothetical protein
VEGPWEASFEQDRWVIQHEGPFGPRRALAVTAGSYPAHEGNARLIAAAPDLLDALIACLKSGRGETDSNEAYLPPVIRDKARAAIVKAAQP